MVSVDQAYMVGHMKNADGSINNKNVVLSAACEAAELFQCMMSVNQKLEDWQRFNHKDCIWQERMNRYAFCTIRYL